MRWFFLNVTSDTPAALAMAAWLFGSPLLVHMLLAGFIMIRGDALYGI